MNLWKTIKLGFDRSFSGSWWHQLVWLMVMIGTIIMILFLFKPETVEAWDFLNSFIDTGNLAGIRDHYAFFIGVTFLGAIFFGGMLIAVLSNILERGWRNSGTGKSVILFPIIS